MKQIKTISAIVLMMLCFQSKGNDTCKSIVEIPQPKKVDLKFPKQPDQPYVKRLKRTYFLGGTFVTTLVFFAIGYANN